MSNPFFLNHGPFKINEILDLISTDTKGIESDQISDVKDLITAKKMT